MNSNDSDVIRQNVLKFLHDAPASYVGFRKVDGTRRAIRGTLNKEVLEQALGQFGETLDESKTVSKSESVVSFYDLDANWWKSAKVDNIDMILMTDLNEHGDGRVIYFNRADNTVIVKPVVSPAINMIVHHYLNPDE